MPTLQHPVGCGFGATFTAEVAGDVLFPLQDQEGERKAGLAPASR